MKYNYKKILLVFLVFVLTLIIIGNNKVMASGNSTNYFSSTNSERIETDGNIIYGNILNDNFNYSQMMKEYNNGQGIIVYNDNQSGVYNFVDGNFYKGFSMMYLKSENGVNLGYFYKLSNPGNNENTSIKDVLSSSHEQFYKNTMDKVMQEEFKTKLNGITVSKNSVEQLGYSLLSDPVEYYWSQIFNNQYTFDFQPYGRITTTAKVYKSTIDTQDYYRTEVTNEWNTGYNLSQDPINGSNYDHTYYFTDQGNAYIELQLSRSSQYISPIYEYGNYPVHGEYFPLTVPTTVTITNQRGVQVGVDAGGSFNPTTYTGEVSGKLSFLASWSHTYTYSVTVPTWNAQQTGTIDNDGYLAYQWTFSDFKQNVDNRKMTLNRDMGTMFTINNQTSIPGFTLSLYVGMQVHHYVFLGGSRDLSDELQCINVGFGG